MAESDRGRAPSHRAYIVLKNGEKSYWRQIGAAWKHGDGDGFSLKLDCLPIGGADIVVRSVNARPEVEDGGERPRRPGRNGGLKDKAQPAP